MYPGNFYSSWNADIFARFPGSWGAAFILLFAWSLVWKGFALWKSAREGSKAWFVILLIINTAGILEILYLYVFSRKGPAQTSEGATGKI